MFEIVGRLVMRARWVVIAAWLVLAIGAVAFAPSLSSVGSAEESSFLPRNVESMRERVVVAQAFPAEAAASSATIVFSRASGMTEADHAFVSAFGTWLLSQDAPASVHDAVSNLQDADRQPQLASMYRSADGTTELISVQLKVASFQRAANLAVDAIRAQLIAARPDGMLTEVSGTAGIGRDYLAAISEGTDRTTLVTIALVVLILLLIYRAPLAALVPVATIGAAFAVSRGALGLLAQAGWQVPSLLDSFIVVLVFGVGTDYTIFLISRYREELGRGEGMDTAILTTVRRIGAVITASAATVIVGLTSMAVARFGLIATIGPALALTIAITLICGLTLAPSLARACGKWLYWPRHQANPDGDPAARTGAWDRLARAITRRPGRVAAAVVAVLAVPLLAVPSLRLNFDMLQELPPDRDARAGYEQVAAHFDRGQILPISVLLQAADSADLSTPAGLAMLARVTGQLQATPGVQTVRSLVDPNGTGTVSDAFRPSVQLATMASSLSVSGNPTMAIATLGRPETLAAIDGAVAYVHSIGAGFADLAVTRPFLDAAADLGALRDGVAAYQAAGAGSPSAQAALASLMQLAPRLPAELTDLAAVMAARPDDLLLPAVASATSSSASAALAQMLQTYLSPNSDVTRLYVVTSDDPYSPAAFDTVARMRDALAQGLEPGGPLAGSLAVTSAVGGATAESADVQSTITDDFSRVGLITIIGILLVLVLLLRSIVAPVFLVLTVLLSYGTTLGLSTLLFQGLLGQPGVNYFIPIIVFVLLVALGSDYNIFLMSRVREESAHRDLRAGITVASARTGTVITSAGIILAGTFAALMSAPLQMLFQTGAAVAMGVLIDTFLVRSLLIPALTALFGDFSWWPSRPRPQPLATPSH